VPQDCRMPRSRNALFISLATVKTHPVHVYAKLGIETVPGSQQLRPRSVSTMERPARVRRPMTHVMLLRLA